MAVDFRHLAPVALVRLLNSTPLGEVVSPPTIYRHQNRAGFRIGDGKTIDFLRYAAWLARERHFPKPQKEPADYEDMKAAAGARNRALSAEGRDIGELPAVVNAERKARAASDFRFFCETYFPDTFTLAWSPDHLKVIGKIEEAVLHGGLFALAMPRASGKTSICECACLWAILFGHREFVCLIGSDEAHAEAMLDSIKMEFDINDPLLDDFPEAVYPIRCLEGIPNRCGGQTYRRERTHMEWTSRTIVLPTIPNSRASGAIIKVAGLTGRIRGMKYKRADGKVVRPSLVILDDPQTDESARSLSQCATRERILAGAVLGLAGPGKKISGIMPCTVIRPGDMADRILDRDTHPDWNGERMRMVYKFPANEKLWARYGEIRAESLRLHGDIREATEFYREHREAMDEGAVVAWPERFNPDEVSAIQHAMNLKLQDEAAFAAEYQNEPLPEPEADAVAMLKVDDIVGRVNGYARRSVPLSAEYVTAFIDCHDRLLYYTLVAWAANGTGWVIDYGTYPEQHEGYFTMRSARRTLSKAARGAGREAAILAGLQRLTDTLMVRTYRRTDDAEMRVGMCLIDANYVRDIVYGFCRTCQHRDVLPSHGRYIGAAKKPMAEYTRKPGERLAAHWMIASATRGERVRHAVLDVNYWKTSVATRLAAAPGDPGALTLWGRDPAVHRLWAEHITAERPVRVSGPWGVVDEWHAKTDDNHWLDCLVGCAAAASMLGVGGTGEQSRRRERKRYTQADLILKRA